MPRMPVAGSPAYFPDMAVVGIPFGGSASPSAGDGKPSVMSTTVLAWQEKQIANWFPVVAVPSDSQFALGPEACTEAPDASRPTTTIRMRVCALITSFTIFFVTRNLGG